MTGGLATPVYGALLALFFVFLSARVILYRRGHGVSLGDADDPHLRRRIRGQANCAEYASIGLLLLLMMELQGAHGVLFHATALIFLAGRLLHGAAFSRDRQWIFGRFYGMALTFAGIILAALANLVLAAS